VIEGGAFDVRVGTSSRDIRLTTRVELGGEDLLPPLAPDSPASAWLDHPMAGPRLRPLIGIGRPGDMSAMLDDPQHGQMMRAIPLVRLTRFPGFPTREDDLPRLAEEANTAVGAP